MNISGIIQPSYESRAASSAPISRAMTAPQYLAHPPYSTAAAESMVLAHQEMPVHHQSFNFSSYPNNNMSMLASGLPENYIHQRPAPPPRLAHPAVDGRRSYASNGQQPYVDDFHGQTPSIKPEPLWSPTAETPARRASKTKTKTTSPTVSETEPTEVSFDTEVDTLMKAIQAKSQTSPTSQNPPEQPSSHRSSQPAGYGHTVEAPAPAHESREDLQEDFKNVKRRYKCQNCNKCFYQKTHLDIHERSHTGFKPYPCKEPGCGRSFSQLGNLRTHERRHTGERPYHCEICGKRFAQRGNVRAHRIVHEQAKPYLCRLDQCGKQFTQLGNLKSHQNKFHAQTIRDLTTKFASIRDGDVVASADKELWEYFANLYKNSNKGIKGRGKDRKVGTSPAALDSRMRGLHVGRSAEYARAFAAMNHGLKTDEQYGANGMYGDDEGSQSGSRSAGGSSVEPYDDAPSDSYDDSSRANELAFGDRIY